MYYTIKITFGKIKKLFTNASKFKVKANNDAILFILDFIIWNRIDIECDRKSLSEYITKY